MFEQLELVQKIAVWAIPVLLALTMPAAVSGYVARYFGDHTAEREGRLSFNPIKHVDLIGTIALPLVSLALNAGFLIGWPKMVPLNPSAMRNPRRDIMLTMLSMPALSLLMAVAWTALLKVSISVPQASFVWDFLRYSAVAGISINLVFMIFNLIPLPPLAGGLVLLYLLPRRAAMAYARIEPYGFIVMLALMAVGVLGAIIYWPLVISQGLLFYAFNINSSALL